MKKLLLTGNRGAIGSKLEKNLVSFYEVIGFDIADAYDIRDREQVIVCFDKINPEIVIHAAAIPHPLPEKDFSAFDRFFDINVIGTKNIVETSLRFNVEKLVYFSSGSVYGWDDCESIEAYGVSKRIAEEIVRYASGQGLNCSILRLAPLVESIAERFFYAKVSYETIFSYVQTAIEDKDLFSIFNVSDINEETELRPSWKIGKIDSHLWRICPINDNLEQQTNSKSHEIS